MTFLQYILLVSSGLWLQLPESYAPLSGLIILSPHTPWVFVCFVFVWLVCLVWLVLIHLLNPHEIWAPFAWLWLLIRWKELHLLQAFPPTLLLLYCSTARIINMCLRIPLYFLNSTMKRSHCAVGVDNWITAQVQVAFLIVLYPIPHNCHRLRHRHLDVMVWFCAAPIWDTEDHLPPGMHRDFQAILKYFTCSGDYHSTARIRSAFGQNKGLL